MEAYLATPSRPRAADHRLVADGYHSAVARSHLSPDGGSRPRAAPHRLEANGYMMMVSTALHQRDGKDRFSLGTNSIAKTASKNQAAISSVRDNQGSDSRYTDTI